MRWDDSLRTFCHQQGLGEWKQAAQNKDAWNAITEAFKDDLGTKVVEGKVSWERNEEAVGARVAKGGQG